MSRSHDHSDHHGHDHGHHRHVPDLKSINRAFVFGIALNSVFVAVEAIWGWLAGSMALMADAGHNLSDVASLVLALMAMKLHDRKPSLRFSYGLRKSTILVSLFNAIVIYMAMGYIGFEALMRMGHPVELDGMTVAAVAGVGIVINTLTALMFMRDKDSDLNIKGAYMHLAADALVSAGVVVTGGLIYMTGWYWLDSAVSLAIIAVIFWGTWELLKESLTLALGGTPKDVDLQKIRQSALMEEGVLDIHHIHVWAISTTQNALTAHLVVPGDGLGEGARIVARLKERFYHMGIQHTTLEVEPEDAPCDRAFCI